jgi:hypothetical protein
MPIDLRISADSVQEFDQLLARFTGASSTAIAAATVAAAPAPSPAPAAQPAASSDTGVGAMSVADVKTAAASADRATLDRMLAEEQAGKKRTGAISAIEAAIAAAPTQNPDGTPIAPTPEPTPQPTPGGTDAPPAESIPPNQAAAVDPFASPAAGADATASQAGASPASAETVAATPAATSPEVQAAQNAGEVTVQQLKDAMADLLKAKSASFAMATLEQATGCKSLTSGSPSVVEKAKDDPGILRRTLDALVAAKTAA